MGTSREGAEEERSVVTRLLPRTVTVIVVTARHVLSSVMAHNVCNTCAHDSVAVTTVNPMALPRHCHGGN